MIASIWRNIWCVFAGKKSTLSFTFSLGYWKEIANLLFLVVSACLASHTQSDAICLHKTFAFICRQKYQLHSPLFSGDTAKTCKLPILGTLSMLGYTVTQNDSINLENTLIFICIPKINLSIHFFLSLSIILAFLSGLVHGR